MKAISSAGSPPSECREIRAVISKIVRIGTVADQDSFRRQDVMAMTPSERIMCLVRLRDRQFGAVAIPVRTSCAVSYRVLAASRKG